MRISTAQVTDENILLLSVNPDPSERTNGFTCSAHRAAFPIHQDRPGVRVAAERVYWTRIDTRCLQALKADTGSGLMQVRALGHLYPTARRA